MRNSQETLDWERAVIQELNHEHIRIRMSRKLPLRPVNIRLFNSETAWGQFDSLTRTISISRQLVHKFSWFQVLGVFRHEVAHQYVEEAGLRSPKDSKTHGERFQEACRKVGVPPQFAKAGVNLQTSDLDWRTEKQDDATERILEKIRKLLALANSTNENEALLAMTRVREIYAKHNLEQMEARSKEGFVHQVISLNKKRIEYWELKILDILISYFFVKVLTFEQFEAQTGERKKAFEIIGTRENVLMAEYVYAFLVQQTQFMVDQLTIPGARKMGQRERNSFRLGILDGFARKLSVNFTSAQATSAPENSTALVVGRALAKFHKDPMLADYLAEIYPRLGQRRASSATVNSEAFEAGQQLGGTITLNKPITEKQGNLGRYLTTSSS